MARQDRAERTRRTLLRAAADEMAEKGYAGASMSRISTAADVTIGGLTFHFPSKAALAEAVRESGCALTCGALSSLMTESRSPKAAARGELRRVVTFTRTLARLLGEEPAVRAAARLAWDFPDDGDTWYAMWLPSLGELVERARPDFTGWTTAEAVTATAVSVVTGAEFAARTGVPRGVASGLSPTEHVDRVWGLVLGARPPLLVGGDEYPEPRTTGEDPENRLAGEDPGTRTTGEDPENRLAGEEPAGTDRGGDRRTGDLRAGDPRTKDLRAGDPRTGNIRVTEHRLPEHRLPDHRAGERRTGEGRVRAASR
ncbi:TetR/AcrR family transcriptional regulator [Streptomyces paromomycinus]|uniref:TetR family transcriptional regulator n=1 Tax=Streptomyces paromomycinus TaxID=92743 RepID=A0A401W6Z3_STREY|nr:TetR/AcrR family transcriptional regulator [Streptomyces paromomycinus]GCD45123.1 TetR family transcriptional regulator [Streptomyces paromomycinus]